MAAHFLSAAARMRRDAQRDASHFLNDHDAYREAYDLSTALSMKTFIRDVEKSFELEALYKSMRAESPLGKATSRRFFITIRPDESKCDFDTFKLLVEQYLQRKMFEDFEMSFEQKGHDDPTTMGKGFHCHIIGHMNPLYKDKSKIIRDTYSTFKNVLDQNAIQVDCLRTNADLERVRGYIVDYTSNDDHKVTTKQYDAMWREAAGLQHIYKKSPN